MPKHTNIQLHEVVINLCQQGKVSREIAKVLLIDKSTVNRITNYKSTNSLIDKPRSRPRKTTKRVNKIIKRKSIADVKKNCRGYFSRTTRRKSC